MAKLANRAKMTISSTGTGNITLASAVAGYQSFLDAGVSDGDQIRYIIEDNNGADWEIGTAAVSNNSTVLVRTVEESSAANNAALNLTSSAKVFIGVTAKDLDNAAPIFTTTPPSSLILDNDGSTAVTLNAKAYDENSGIPVQYSWDAWATGGTTIYDASSLPPQLASAPSINQSTGAFSLVGSSNTANVGAVNFRVKASDGVKVATHVSQVSLRFIPQSGNLFGRWDMGVSSSYSGSGTTWNDLSGNGRNLTIQNGAYNASGFGGTPVWEWTSTNARIDLPTDLSSVKTYMIIWGFPTGSTRQILINSGSSVYAGYINSSSSGDTIDGGSAHTGETVSSDINGNALNATGNSNTAYGLLEPNKLNIHTVRGWKTTATSTTYANYTNYNHAHQLRTIMMWTVMLTDAEIKEIYDLFPSSSMATWDGS